MTYRPPLLISSLFLSSFYQYYLQYFLSPKGSFLFFQEQFLSYACIYHNKRSYLEMSRVYIHLYKTPSTKQVLKWINPSIGGRMHPKGCLNIYTSPLVGGCIPRDTLQFIKSISGWIHPKGCLKIYTSPLVDEYIPRDALKFIQVH